ncbi:ribosomal protection-like ABC-F family protein [Kaarinaea lacus]
MLKFTHLDLRRGSSELLHDVSLVIHAKQKVGITGANGAGKSTLFALILGHTQADAGEVSLPPGLVIAHVAQEAPAEDKAAVEYVIDGDEEYRRIESAIEAAEHQHDGTALANLHMQFETIGGYSAKSRAAALMHGLGFNADNENQAVTAFSGGWRMRLNLAKALMCRSDLLLLDEPTNHLDLDAVMWLEDWLRSYQGTLLLISHDRDFLDNVATHIVHIEQRTLTAYSGNYSAFEVRRAERLALQKAAFEKQQKEIKHMQSFVERFRAKATKARQAQSRIKALQRMELIGPAHVDSPFEFSFYEPNKLPNPLLALNDCAVGYGDTALLTKIRFSIHPGDRLGLLGHNGAGKSTLVKLLARELHAMRGEYQEAKDLAIGYFAQHQLEQLDLEASPFLHLQRLDPQASEQQVRTYLGGFAFQGDRVFETVAHFSGGEKARLVLALLIYQKPNLLLLDEPTNHLDLEMRHALTVALQDYQGALVVVSHDRFLLRSVCDQFYLVHAGQAQPFDGDLNDYRQWLKDSAPQDSANEVKEVGGVSKKQQRQANAEKRKQLQPLKNQLKKAEAKLEQLNQEKLTTDARLADSALYEVSNKQELATLLKQQARVQQELAEVEEQCLELMEKLEAFESN